MQSTEMQWVSLFSTGRQCPFWPMQEALLCIRHDPCSGVVETRSCAFALRSHVMVYNDRHGMQVALSNLVSIHNNAEEVLSRVNASVVEGRSCKLVAGRHRVCFFPCMRFNYCHAGQSCCTDAGRLPISLTTLNELMSARVKASALLKLCGCCRRWLHAL